MSGSTYATSQRCESSEKTTFVAVVPTRLAAGLPGRSRCAVVVVDVESEAEVD
jgi:hypothetical protein